MTSDFKFAHITGQEMRDHWGPILDRIEDEMEASRDPRLKEMEEEIERLREECRAQYDRGYYDGRVAIIESK